MKIAVLLAAYGSANPQSQRAITNFENLCRMRFPEMPVRWAFTSLLLRERMANMRKKSDSLTKALEKLRHEQYRFVAVQPLQVISGQEYNDVLHSVGTVVNNRQLGCAVGAPLMSTGEDAQKVADALLTHLPPERKIDEDVVFVGHGARHKNFYLYGSLARELAARDSRLHLGTMSGDADVEKILPALRSEVVWLVPLLSIVGKHVTYDIAGENPLSWKSRIEREGHSCGLILQGISEYASIANLWLNNLAQAVTLLQSRQIN